MTMEDSNFNILAEEMLECLNDGVDDALGDEIDVDMQGGILTLTLSDGGQYIINKHAPNREIWMSSPVSGATHFACHDGRWISTRDATRVLDEMLAAELQAKYGVAVQF
ncbi:MAG: iron donor protein CyaY [Bacteroidales bacterium]